MSYDEDDCDWESSGEEEMDKLHKNIKKKLSTVDVLGKLSSLHSLVELCQFALICTGKDGCAYTNRRVSTVLCDYVLSEISTIDEELAKK
jgi:hypothetical protein